MAKAAKKTAAISVVTQVELMTYETTKAQLVALNKRLKEEKAKLEQMEADLIARLKSGAKVSGDYNAAVESGSGRCSPKWKDEYIAHFEAEHGETAAAIELRVKEKYPATHYDVLVITKKAV